MPPALNTIPRSLTRIGAAAQNALEVARFGGLATESEGSPYDLATEQRVYRLRHYYPDGGGKRPSAGAPVQEQPVVLVPPLMLAADIYDLGPDASAVTILHEHGCDPWVIDFGAPEREEGGLERTLADHVLAISDAVDRVAQATGSDVHLAGYSQGGMFCYQTAAVRRNAGIASLITFGATVDARLGPPLGIPEHVASAVAGVVAQTFRGGAVPAWFSRTTFRLLDPVKSVRNQLEFILQLHDREALLPRERQRRFLEGEGWVAWPGPALADFVRQFIEHNRLLEGGFVIGGRLFTLADIECPILSVTGTVDELAPAPGVRAIRAAAPRAQVYELALQAGHFGLVVGSLAAAVTWPTVAEWTRWRPGEVDLPEGIAPISTDESGEPVAPVRNRVTYGLELAGGVGADATRLAREATRRTARSVREVAREAAHQLPRLARLEQIQPGTRISLGHLIQERRRKAPDDVLFLFEDRAYNAAETNERIDNVVRGLISIGVRQGEHVGVLMAARPSALALIAAISRVGAVAVLLRPDGDVGREAELGVIERVIADPERASEAAKLGPSHTFVLGGGGGQRELQTPGATDMEQIDPGAVTLPRWYQPDPGRASDVAFIVFTGEGPRTRMSRITNGRWAMSAFGMASSAALTAADTVYSVTPPYHPSGLMMGIGGAVAGGARLAMAREFNPATFWEESRRYGVTVATYTWTSLHDLVEAPPLPAERHHGVRLFAGSGMPRGLWRRVEERFWPARVLEFYASTEGEAILVNLRDVKRGSMGRPLPGSAEVQIAAYDIERGGLLLKSDGFAKRCRVEEVGMLLARTAPNAPTVSIPMRGVFARDDAWLATGDLFHRDSDGDYWHVDSVGDVIHTAGGPVFSTRIRDALGELPAVDLAVAYPVQPGSDQPDRHALAVAAVTVRAGAELTADDIAAAVRGLPESERPAIVHVVDQIPVTTWFRPDTAALRAAGLPEPTPGKQAWYRDRHGDAYQPLTDAALETFAPSAA